MDLNEQSGQQQNPSMEETIPADDNPTTHWPEHLVPRPKFRTELNALLVSPHTSVTNSHRQSTLETSASVDSSVTCTKGKRKSFGPQSPEKTKRVRKTRACIRCRMYHETVCIPRALALVHLLT